MGFLIDTNIWIAIERGKISAADIHAITKQAPIFVSPVNIAELRYGLELMSDPKSKQRAATMLRRMHRKPMLRITGETADIFGTLAAKLSQAGRSHDFRIQDLWLASQAVQRKFAVLTGNAKDFKDIPDLKVIEVKVT